MYIKINNKITSMSQNNIKSTLQFLTYLYTICACYVSSTINEWINKMFLNSLFLTFGLKYRTFIFNFIPFAKQDFFYNVIHDSVVFVIKWQYYSITLHWSFLRSPWFIDYMHSLGTFAAFQCEKYKNIPLRLSFINTTLNYLLHLGV